MNVFDRTGSIVRIRLPVFITNVVVLYGFFFVTDHIIKLRGNAVRGFFCVDPSIQYTQKPSTVTSVQHRVYNISLMVISILMVEAFCQARQSNRAIVMAYCIGNSRVPKYVVNVLTFTGYSQIGYIINELLVKFVKSSVGRLRPYFIAVCNPLPIKECEILNPNIYIVDYQCRGNPDEIEEARRSFYSGHSAVTMYCTFWTVLYLQARLKPLLQNNVIVSIVQSLITSGGLFICISRISDNKHHCSDVLAGIAVGTTLAFISAVCWGKLFDVTDVGADLSDDEYYDSDRKENV